MINLSEKREYYTVYKKKKPNGKFRIITAPNNELKTEQQLLASKLETIYIPPNCVSGFIKGRNASWGIDVHCNKKWVCELDIKDFFPSITKRHLIYPKSLGGQHELTEYEAEIATLNDRLVQGSPCSPIISNIHFSKIDLFFHSYLKTIDIDYTRYADNIIISGNNDKVHFAIHTIKLNVSSLGFYIPKSKVKIMYQNQEQKVLGITLNCKVSINHKLRKKLKNHIKYCARTEVEEGYLSYINSINKEQYDSLHRSL